MMKAGTLLSLMREHQRKANCKKEVRVPMIKATVGLSQILLLIFAGAGSIYCLKLKSKKSIAVCCCCLIVFSLLALKFNQTFVKVSDEIIIIAQNEKCEESRGTEVDISNLRIDGDVIKSYNITNGHWYDHLDRYSWRPPEDSRWDGTATNSITIKVPVGWERSIQFQGNKWRGYVTVEKPDGTTETFDTYAPEVKIYSCEIGQSDTKLLLLQGVADISSYALILGLLTTLFVWGIKKEGTIEKSERQSKRGEVRPTSGSKRQWVWSGVFAGALAILLAIFSVANLQGRLKTDALILATGDQIESEPITAGAPYTQVFTANGTFNQIRLRFCTYGRENTASTTVQLVDDATEAVLGSWEIENASVSKDVVRLSLQEAQNKGVYRLVVEGHNPDEKTSIGIYLQEKSVYNGELFVSESLHDKDISIGLYQETNLGIYRLVCVLVAAVICAWLACVLLFIRKLELWKSAFVLVMGFGCVYLAIFPAGCINDSWKHYVTAYQCSNQILGITESETGTVMMRKDDCDEFIRYRNLSQKASITTYFEEFDEASLLCRNQTLMDCGENSLIIRSKNAASSIAYFPQILGLTLGRILSLGTIPCMFLARFLQLFSVAVMVSAAIKIIPSKKEILLLIALLPIFLQQVTAFSYDGIAFGLAFLFISVCMKLAIQTEKISVSSYAFLVIAVFGLCACRGGMYIFLLFLLTLIPKRVLSTLSKLYLLGGGIFVVLSLYGRTYLGVSSGGNTDTLTFGPPLQHPIKLGLQFISSIIENIDIYWSGSFGQQMGWSEGIIPHFIAFGFMVMQLIVSLDDSHEESPLGVKTRVIYLLPVLLTLGFCLGTMYLAESSRATEWNIWGVQGRYFLPVMPLVFFQVQNRSVVLARNVRPTIICAFCAWETIEIFYLMRTFVMR